MSSMQGWPGAGPTPGPPVPDQGANDGRRIGIVALVVVAVVILSFGIAKATGADNRDDGALAGPAPTLPTDLGDLEDSDLGASGGSGGDSGGGDSGGSDLGGSGGDSGATGGVTPTPTPEPTPTPTDPMLDEYLAVTTGDCLGNWMIDDYNWASDYPEVTGCGADNAGVWVSQTSDSTSDCPVDSGRSYLSYTGTYETVALCVTRQFAVGQCFLGMSDNSANLMSWVDCEATSLPDPYSQMFNVTGVYSAPANVTGNECSQYQGDTTEYWWWLIDAESTLLCAVVY